MSFLTNFLIALIVAGWIATFSVFSIQNITPISLKFASLQSIQLPIGVLLSFCVGAGMIFGAAIPLLLPRARKSQRNQFSRRNTEDLDDFDFD